MTTSPPAQTQPLTQRPAWKALAEHYQKMRNLNLRQLFANDPRYLIALDRDSLVPSPA